MEDWEKEHIKDNLPQLLDLTTCTAPVIAHLISKNVLSKYDSSELSAITTPFDKSKRLYEILSTKTRGYSELHKVLHTEKQSGACEILENGFSKQWPIKISKTMEYDEAKEISNQFRISERTTTFYMGTFGGRDVAVKKVCIKNDRITPEWNEVKLLLESDAHENIIRYLTIERRGYSALMAFERCITTLYKLYTSQEAEKPEMSPLEILRQATLGVTHLHSLKIVHGNLNPENVVFCKISTNVVRVKIADLRVGKPVDGVDKLSYRRVSLLMDEALGWMAPEILKIMEKYGPENCRSVKAVQKEINEKLTFASDVFSLGCIFYFVLTGGQLLFGNFFNSPRCLLDNKFKFDKLTAQGSTLVHRMIERDPNHRLHAAEIILNQLLCKN